MYDRGTDTALIELRKGTEAESGIKTQCSLNVPVFAMYNYRLNTMHQEDLGNTTRKTNELLIKA